jgi:tRNA nucleotidyltransferase (CCA-adding enzyme)
MPITKKHKEIVNFILKEVSPKPKDKKILLDIQKEILKKIKLPDTTSKLGGSGAKNTWLKNTHDIDIYVKFNYAKYKDKSNKLSDILHKVLKKSFSKVDRIHGSRDYFQISHKGYTLEIVPILAITKPEQSKNITDFSIFHVKYVTDKIKKNPKLANEIRVSKVFARANRFYGAESHIGGFSGYVLELLVSKYGSFLKFANAVSIWKSNTVIGNKKEAEELNWAKKQSPLILIDPVQPERNAAAALSTKQYDHIISICKKFISSPKLEHFEIQPVDINKLQKKGNLTIIEVKPLKAKKDIAGAKALKAFEFLVKHLDPFEVIDSFFEYDDKTATYYISTKKTEIPQEYIHYGPPLNFKKEIVAFKKTNKNVKIDKKQNKVYTIRKTINPDLNAYIKNLLIQKEVSERIKDICLMG